MSALKIKDAQGNWIEVPMIKGDKGDKGDTYTLTEQDKQDIADLVEVPESFEIHICSSAEYDSTTRVPTITNPDEKTFYLVPSEDGTSPDLFVEWAYVNNAWEMFGSASIDLSGYLTDVQINGASIVNNGVADIPIGNNNIYGVMRSNVNYGTTTYHTDSGDFLGITFATPNEIKNPNTYPHAIVPYYQDQATFYGLAKVSGDTTQSASSNAVGTYTDDAKASIQLMLGVPSTDDVVTDVQVNGTSITSDGVANLPIATKDNLGVIKRKLYSGVAIDADGSLRLELAGDTTIKNGVSTYTPIVPQHQHKSTFYGLAKAAGHDEKDSTLSVGQYTPEAKGAIQSMLGIDSLIAPTETNPFSEAHAIGDLFIINGTLYKAKTAIAVGDVLDDGVNVDAVNVDDVIVKDVQINGNTVVNNGVVSVPIGTLTDFGVVKIGRGLGVNDGLVTTNPAISSDIKAATANYKQIVPSKQHEAVFYGLATASGDTTQKNSSNAIGQYTDDAKASIKQMLGVVDSYDSLVVNVTGTDPVITAQPSYRYNCGEVASLTVTPPSSGTIDIIFTSGTTPTVLDLPSTVKMPSWWIGVEANTTYEMCITDGVYCGVMSWDA